MRPADLQHFIALLESEGELARIAVETDPVLEIAAITDRVCKSTGGGKALLFEKPRGARFPVATNLFGSRRRVELALGLDSLDRLTERVAALLGQIPVPDLVHLDRQIAALPGFSRYAPRVVDQTCHARIEMKRPDLSVFPFLQSWPGDGSAGGRPRYISLPLVVTANPDGSCGNCGIYRAQVRGAAELAIQWRPGSGAARHREGFQRLGKPMPVAIGMGGDPAITFSAMSPLPGELDEMTFAGFLRGAAIDTTACRTVPLRVPTDMELVIEGYVDPSEMVDEGPFGNHTGMYAPSAPASLMRITAITHRTHAVVPATVVGPPPMEDCWMALAWERMLLAFVRRLIPSVAEVHFPPEWVFHQSAIIFLENPCPAMVRETAGLLWDTPWFASARLLVFVDVQSGNMDMSGIAWRCINLVESAHDIFMDTTGKRCAFDATGCRLGRQRIGQDSGTARTVVSRWKEYGLGT